jgi:hypothetical protein
MNKAYIKTQITIINLNYKRIWKLTKMTTNITIQISQQWKKYQDYRTNHTYSQINN